MANEFEQNFAYPDLRDVDPNFTAIPEEVYSLKVVKLELKQDKNGKSYLSGTFGVVNHPTQSARRLWHNFWDISGQSGRDVKALRRLMDVTGIPQTEGGEAGFRGWVDTMTAEQPSFKALVRKQTPTTWNKETKQREIKLGPDGNPLPDENVIDFKNLAIA